MRETAQKTTNTDTKSSYAYTSARRVEAKNKVYSVNIPFSNAMQPKLASTTNVFSPEKTPKMMSGFSQSHTTSFLSPSARTSRNSRFGETTSSNFEVVAERKQNMQNLTASHVKMKFPENSPYN